MKLLCMTCAWLIFLPGCRERNPDKEDPTGGNRATTATHEGNQIQGPDRSDRATSPWGSSEELLRFMASNPVPDERKEVRAALQAEFERFAEDHPNRITAFREFVLRYIGEAEPGPERDRLIDFLLATAGADGHRETLAVVLEFYSDPVMKGSAVGTVFSRAAKVDPAWVYEAAAKLDEPTYRDSAYWSATGVLCRDCTDFPAAIKLVAQFTDGTIPHQAMVAIADKDWRGKLPADLAQVLHDVFGSVKCSKESRNYLVDALVKPMSKRGMAATVALLLEFEITDQSAWGSAAQYVPDVTPETARLFLENLPKKADYECIYLLHRLKENNGADAMWQTLSGLPGDRQEWYASRIIRGYAQDAGVPRAIEDARAALADEAYLKTLKTLAGGSRAFKMNEEDLATVQAALAEAEK